jgi:glucosyl-3-phosphoglycerate synthase
VAGHHPLLDFLLSFRYPLAGEFAMHRSLAEALPGAGGWRLEIATLCELFRRTDPRAICQVDGGSGYDHKHQPAADALVEMCREVAQELLAQLAREGLPCDGPFQQALERAFRRESADALRRYAALARINGLPFDTAEESAMSEAFAGLLGNLSSSVPHPLPSWASLRAERPAAVEEFVEAALYTP